MSDQDIAAGLRYAVGPEFSKQSLIQLVLAIKQLSSQLNLEVCSRGSVALVLDRVLINVIR